MSPLYTVEAVPSAHYPTGRTRTFWAARCDHDGPSVTFTDEAGEVVVRFNTMEVVSWTEELGSAPSGSVWAAGYDRGYRDGRNDAGVSL